MGTASGAGFGSRFKGFLLPPPHDSLCGVRKATRALGGGTGRSAASWRVPVETGLPPQGHPSRDRRARRSALVEPHGLGPKMNANRFVAPDSNAAGDGGFAWSCRIDTHNDLRLAVDPLSGGLLHTIYAESWESVRSAGSCWVKCRERRSRPRDQLTLLQHDLHPGDKRTKSKQFHNNLFFGSMN